MKASKKFFIGALAAAFLFPGLSATEAKDIAATSPSIQYFGRWDAGDVYRCAQGATYIRANFTGTSLKADLTGPGDWWRVSVDGGPFRRFRPEGKNTVLAENLAPGRHSVLLVRSTEGYMGLSEFRGFIVDDDADIAAPDARKKRRIEFVGDSITAGAVNDGVRSGENYNDIEDNDMSFGPQLARALGADYSVLAKSGEGVIHNWAESWPGKEVHTADRYAWTFYYSTFSDDNLKWDPAQFPVDAVVIAMGTNDFSDRNRRPTEAEFKTGYKKLITTVRAMNPKAVIICTEPVPSWVGEDARRWIRTSVEEMTQAGDKKLHFIPVNEAGPLLAETDYVGDNTHPTKEGSAKIAAYLKDKVAAILGWQ